MSGIDMAYRFPEIDPGAESYLEDIEGCGQDTYPYSFSSLPELKRLMEQLLGDVLDEGAILEAAKEAFRNKPADDLAYTPDEDRTVVDFIYEM